VIGEAAARSVGETRGRGLFKVDDVKSGENVELDSKRSVSVSSRSILSISWLTFDLGRSLLVVEVFSRLAVEVVLLDVSSKTSMQKTTESR
jgi:hypothetical protein